MKDVIATTPDSLLEIAVKSNADLEKIERLMDLKDRWEKGEAKKAYTVAMTAFKAEAPVLLKDKAVSYSTEKGTTKYNHASLPSAVETISPLLSKHGLSASWDTNQKDGNITVSCVITHVGGHGESTSLSASADNSGGKNSIQAIGSTVAYLERYTFFARLGLAAKGMDDDGKGSEPEKPVEAIDEQTKNRIMFMQKKLGISDANLGDRFNALYKTSDLNMLTAAQGKEVFGMMSLKIQAAEKEKTNGNN